MQSQKWQNDLCSFPKANHSIPWWSKPMPQPVTLKKLKLNGSMKNYGPSRTNTQKRCPLHYRDLEWKSGTSRATWSNRQIRPWSTEWNRAKVKRVLPRECTGHSKHPLPKSQEMTICMDITRWSIPKSDWLYSLQPKMKKLYRVTKTRPGADCGTDLKLLIANSDLNWRK